EDPEQAAAPEASVQVERLVIPLAQRQVVPGLVAGAVGSARLEKQRPELIAADHVEQPGRRVAANLAGRSVVSEGLGVVVTPLIRNRRVQAEGTDTPPRIQTERVALLVIARVPALGVDGAGGSRPGYRGQTVHWAAGALGTGARRTNVERVAARRARRQPVGVEPREHRLQVQPLERCELGAEDERVVF